MAELSARKLKQAQNDVNNDADFRSLGNVDVKMGIKVGKSMYLICFEAFSCQGVRKISAREIRDADFVIEMSADVWDRYLSGCLSGKGLNLVQFDSAESIVTADPRRKLEFLRYHTSLQAFFEAYARQELHPA